MAAASELHVRDLEILRALARVRYLTTRQVATFFFACPRVARRRLQRLSERDLIAPHRKGIPSMTPYSAWRLTTRGLGIAARAFPEELLPDRLVERVTHGSLHNLEHRDALARLYLDLVAPVRPDDRQTPADMRRWAKDVRARAAAIRWQSDGDVVLRARYLGNSFDVIPDATVTTARRKLRVFVELDRSTKALGRIRTTVERYESLIKIDYARIFSDGFAPVVLFVVPSTARKAHIAKLAQSEHVRALLPEEVSVWLSTEVLGDVETRADDGRRGVLVPAARRTYAAAFHLVRALEQPGLIDGIRTRVPELHELKQCLLKLHAVLTAEAAQP